MDAIKVSSSLKDSSANEVSVAKVFKTGGVGRGPELRFELLIDGV